MIDKKMIAILFIGFSIGYIGIDVLTKTYLKGIIPIICLLISVFIIIPYLAVERPT